MIFFSLLGYDKSDFDWPEYLRDTSSAAAPEDSFVSVGIARVVFSASAKNFRVASNSCLMVYGVVPL